MVFYGVSGPSVARDFILAMLENFGFYIVLGSLRWAQDGAQHRPILLPYRQALRIMPA